MNFFKINFFKKKFQQLYQSIQIRTDILSVQIWIQTVCKSYQQMTLADKELMISEFYYILSNEIQENIDWI